MTRTVLIVAVALLVAASAQAAPGQELLIGLRACRAQPDEKARLACFDALADRADGGQSTSAASAPPASAPAPVAATSSKVASAPPGFGGENLHAVDTPRPQESMTAAVAKVSFNAIDHFTVVLDNGQIWRQLDADTRTARFKPNATVKITKGFLDAYSLAIEGAWGTYMVKRIK